MNKVISWALLLVASSSANAEWVKINTNENLTTYIDPATISKTDDMVRMWGVVDLKESKKEQDGKSFLSAKGLQQYDCKVMQIRKISLDLYSKNMGVGEIVHTYADADKWKWTPVTPGSIAEVMWKTACGKK
jgi:hypothetical protein